MSLLAIDAIASLHYFDREFGIPAVKLLPGEYYVTSADMMMTTVLGSCVSACLRDRYAGVSGMNHFMLPEAIDRHKPVVAGAMHYGAHAMATLVRELYRAGARRGQLEAKVFGGGAVLDGMTQLNVGERNADFVLQYLASEHVPVVAQDLCGKLPRRINFFSATGRVALRKLRRQEDTLLVRRDELALAQVLTGESADHPVETGRDARDGSNQGRAWPW